MGAMRYLDTRSLDAGEPPFTEVVVRGIADGGGLYVPEKIPRLSLADISALAEMPYRRRAAAVFGLFGVDLPPSRIGELMGEAYGSNFDDSRIAPVRTVNEGMHVLELWHGPTSAFKDMALQCLPLFFSDSIAAGRGKDADAGEYLILVATSGDTGKAALEGFADRPRTKIAVFYPADGVSEIQRRQMVTQRGANVFVCGVRGNFDDCQNAVKAAFGDKDFTDGLRKERGIRLSSANSINWGRLLPQVVYYASAYADLAAAGAVAAGEPVDVCVPTGNFGNILGAWYAREAGTPIGRLLCASNENSVLTDFITTGTYDIAARTFVKTPSPSMDILVSSNLERLLFEICRDGGKVRRWVEELADKGSFKVDDETFGAVRDVFAADFVTNDRSLGTIRELFEEEGYLIDPHTAVAWEVARRLKGPAPVLVVATAHWAKFGADTYRALHGLPYGAELPREARDLTDMELLERICAMAPGEKIPAPLAELNSLPERFTQVTDGTKKGVEGVLRSWLDL